MSHILHGENQSAPDFYGLGIAPRILDTLELIKFKTPTPIQIKAIPLAIAGKDVVGIAQTGTGKTHAFAIPMVQLLAQRKGTGLVLAPTRELAIQIDESFHPISHAFGMKTACLIGGAPMNEQVAALRKNPRVIIATPGRLIDHMSRWNVLPQEVQMLVLDEADRMLDMGFAPQIELILKYMPKERQTMLFSATMPKEIMVIAAKYMRLPVSVEIAPPGTTAEKVTHELFIVKRDDKLKLLSQVLSQYHGPTLLFSRTKHNARKLTRAIRNMGHSVAEIHSDRSLIQRREALEGFKSGRYKVLVATDIAARGIDVTGIELVLNYDIPEDASNYVHRIGRTGRAGHKGHAISFAMPDQRSDVRDIEKLIKASLPVSTHPKVFAEEFIPADLPGAKKQVKGKSRPQRQPYYRKR
ncbi:MAG: DEAD/DEAH box helicase [Candidatus Omnitrophica bacterium]|nr:DEAD/DEAH box helicase [Candidatus Omnitrophota bacterium]MBU4477970.1 DEAD/DEAH box helicase [Candidatus Omnitrophota bacterium]MCG2704330.1 DEAD/DEAH box helicase [Candidatus Omnitrophota bacterium]